MVWIWVIIWGYVVKNTDSKNRIGQDGTRIKRFDRAKNKINRMKEQSMNRRKYLQYGVIIPKIWKEPRQPP